ncbi:MAG: hypothetical protein H0T95_04290 [Chthoniobacterales bacterium]|nr:hypothetical protein [Chthoniobacterales bacterium]
MRRPALILFCGLAMARAQTLSPLPPTPAATLIPWLLEEKEELTQLPWRDVIFYTTGKKVLAINPTDETDQRVLTQIGSALDELLKRMSAPDSPVQNSARINEVSTSFENMIRHLLDAAPGLSCDFPKTVEGRVQRSGYPDLRLVDTRTGRVYYVDPKLYAAGSRASSFRTFYFEPKIATNKVLDDAVHLVLGVEHEPRSAGHWNFTRWDIVDLAHLKVRLKAEFQGSNHDIYRPDAIVGTSAKE